MTRHNIVIARVLAPVAISGMEQVQILLLSHVWDCRARKLARNDGHNIVIARVLAPVAISGMEQVQILLLSHVWDCHARKLARNDTGYHNGIATLVNSLAMTRHKIVIARVLAPVAISGMEQVQILLQ